MTHGTDIQEQAHPPPDSPGRPYYRHFWEQHKAQMKGEAEAPQQQHAPPSNPLSRYYYKGFWGHYKGHVQSMLRGTVIGLCMGALIGLAVVGLMAALPLLGISVSAAAGAGSIIAAFAGSGAIFAGHVMGSIGGGAGNVAATHAMEELRQRYPKSDLHELGFGHNYEYSATRDKGKWFHWDVGIPGALLGSLVGALMGIGGILEPVLHLLHVKSLTAVTTPLISTILAPVIVPAAMAGVLGLSYGVNRAKFKTLFNWTDNLPSGNFKDLAPRDKARIAAMERLLDSDIPDHQQATRGGITPKQYQSEYQRLYKEYFEAAFAGGMAGFRRGMVGGNIVGILVGGALGVLLIPVLGMFGVVIGAAFGATYAVDNFSHAGAESGGHADAIKMWEHKRKRLIEQAHANPSLMEHVNQEERLRQQEEAGKDKRLVNWKMLALGLLGGALLGLVLTPVAGHFIAAKLGIDGTLALAGCSATLCGLIGSTFGIGRPVIGGMAKLGDSIYNGLGSEQIAPAPDIPAIGPASELHLLGQRHKEEESRHERKGESPPLPAHVQAILDRPPPQERREYADIRRMPQSPGMAPA